MTTVAQSRWRHLPQPAPPFHSSTGWTPTRIRLAAYASRTSCAAPLASETGDLHDDRSRMARRDYREGR